MPVNGVTDIRLRTSYNEFKFECMVPQDLLMHMHDHELIIGTSASPDSENSIQEPELLSLAGEISSHVDLSDLADCLPGVSLDDTIFNTNDTTRDKIFKLFMLWKSVANRAEDSMAKLLSYLQQLNNSSINAIIKKYGRSDCIFISVKNAANKNACSYAVFPCTVHVPL